MPCWCSHWLFVNPCSKSQSRDGCIIHEAVFWTTPTFRLRKIRLNLNTSAYIPPQNVAWLFFLVIFGLVGNSNSKQRKRKTRRDYGRVTEQDNLFFFPFVRAEPCRSQRQGVMQEPHAPARFARVRPCRYCHSDSTGRG